MDHPLSSQAISHLIGALLPVGYPAIERVAAILCVSPRTLQRRLNEEGISYSDLVERRRCKIACQSLEQTHTTIQDIAATLAYADASSFARAFRRWTGTTPRAWRKQSQWPHETRVRASSSGAIAEVRRRGQVPEGHKRPLLHHDLTKHL